jgi:Uma2 family endonuclease
MTLAHPVTIPFKNLQLTPGEMLTITDVTWEQYEAILEELGEGCARVAYCEGTLEVMSPLPIHERPNRIIGYIVTILLDAEERDWEDFGSTTFKNDQKKAGLEPDTGFYIDNAHRVRDCQQRMDLDVYPPPDLAIESDVTSVTTFGAYQRIGIPEVWVYRKEMLKIYLLNNGQYAESKAGLAFPNLPISTLIPSLVNRALQEGASKVLRDLRQRVQQAGWAEL